MTVTVGTWHSIVIVVAMCFSLYGVFAFIVDVWSGIVKARAKTINQNELAQAIAKFEGKKVEVNVAQIKEVLRIALDLLAQEQPSAVEKLLSRRWSSCLPKGKGIDA